MVAAAAEAPSVSLGAPRAPARHCGAPARHCRAPAAAAALRAAEVPGPLRQAGRLLGETQSCVGDAAGMLPGGEGGWLARRVRTSWLGCLAVPVGTKRVVGEGPTRRASEPDCCSQQASAPDSRDS